MNEYIIGQDIQQLNERLKTLENLSETSRVQTTFIRKKVQFEEILFKLTQGAISIKHVNFQVSKTAETEGSPGLIKFLPLFSGFEGKETSLGIRCAFPPVCFDVDFPSRGLYYRWIDVEYKYRAGNTDETRHKYLGLVAFNV